jgi:hypothetical protein
LGGDLRSIDDGAPIDQHTVGPDHFSGLMRDLMYPAGVGWRGLFSQGMKPAC